VIAGHAVLSVDIRSVDDARRDRALDELGRRIDAIAAATGTTITVTATRVRRGALRRRTHEPHRRRGSRAGSDQRPSCPRAQDTTLST